MLPQGIHRRATLSSLGWGTEGEDADDECNVVKPLRHIRNVPGLSISIEPHPKSGDSEVRIVDLGSGTPIATHRMPAPRQSIGRKVLPKEGLKAALSSAAWEESHDALIRRLTKPKDLEDHCEARQRKISVGTISVKQNQQLEGCSERLAVMSMDDQGNDIKGGDVIEGRKADNTDHSMKFSDSLGMDSGTLTSEPIRLPMEDTFAVLMMAREEEIGRRLKESGCLKECTCEDVIGDVDSSFEIKPPDEVGMGGSGNQWLEALDSKDGAAVRVTASVSKNDELSLVLQEAKAPVSLLSKRTTLKALHLAGLQEMNASLHTDHVNAANITSLSSSMAGFPPMSNCTDWSTCLLEPLNDVQCRLIVLETTHDIDILWKHIKARGGFMLLQLLIFIFVLLWSGVFDLLILIPPT